MSKENNKPHAGSASRQRAGINSQNVKINDGDSCGDVIRFDSGGLMPPGKVVTESTKGKSVRLNKQK